MYFLFEVVINCDNATTSHIYQNACSPKEQQYVFFTILTYEEHVPRPYTTFLET